MAIIGPKAITPPQRVWHATVLVKQFPGSFVAAWDFPVLAATIEEARERVRLQASECAFYDFAVGAIK